MAATVVKTLLVSVCLLNLNLLCVKAGLLPVKKGEVDYTIEVRDAKVESLSEKYFNKQSKLYTTMYNDSFSVFEGIIEFVETPPPDTMVRLNMDLFEPLTNAWIKKPCPNPALVCDFIKNNAIVMNSAYKYSNFSKECPTPPGVYVTRNGHVDTDRFPPHLPESSYRANVEVFLKSTNEIILSMTFYADIVSKSDGDDD